MDLVSIPRDTRACLNLVGGKWQPAHSGESAEILTPYTGKVIGTVAISSAPDVRSVVEGATRAYSSWAAVPLKERTQLLLRFRELVLRQLDKLSHTAAAEAGKTVDEARAGILKGVEVIEFAASIQNLDAGGAMEVSRGVWCQYRREPLGVVAGITPFNFPAMVPFWMYPIALTVGNCFVLKPSEKVPLTSSLIGDLINEAGYPPGTFSIVNGRKEVVDALIDHPDVKALAFVGSTPVAKYVYTRSSALGKRALCLGGAKNHLIVAPDAELHLTVRGVVDSFTGCAGQRCMAASVMIGVGGVDHIVRAIAERVRTLPLGGSMGAIIDAAALQRITNAIAQAETEGAKILVDGRDVAPPKGYEGGNWIGATIIDHATPAMQCAQLEIFGPVLTIIRAKNLTDALEIERRSPFGNATSVFTTHGGVARMVSAEASAGMVGINIGVPVPREPFSFGGRKESRFGHGDITGQGGIDFWSDLKKITSKWADQGDANWMS